MRLNLGRRLKGTNWINSGEFFRSLDLDCNLGIWRKTGVEDRLKGIDGIARLLWGFLAEVGGVASLPRVCDVIISCEFLFHVLILET